MKKLELKHLAPYLPYGLQISQHREDINMDYQSELIQLGIDQLKVTSTRFPYTEHLSYNEAKPLLRPLSNLAKDITLNGEIINPIEEIYNNSWMAMGYEAVETSWGWNIVCNEDNSVLEIWTQKPQVNMWWVTQKLISMHFDVFGLIDAGLAVDINTLTK